MKRILGFPSEFGVHGKFIAVALTFTCVVIGWVFFRTETFSGAIAILEGMVGTNGVILDSQFSNYLPKEVAFIKYSGASLGTFGSAMGVWWILFGSLIVWALPTTQELFDLEQVRKLKISGSLVKLYWQPTPW